MPFDLEIHLSSRKKPLVFELTKPTQFDEFYKELNTNDIVKYGPVIFRRADFLYATMEENE